MAAAESEDEEYEEEEDGGDIGMAPLPTTPAFISGNGEEAERGSSGGAAAPHEPENPIKPYGHAPTGFPERFGDAEGIPGANPLEGG